MSCYTGSEWPHSVVKATLEPHRPNSLATHLHSSCFLTAASSQLQDFPSLLFKTQYPSTLSVTELTSVTPDCLQYWFLPPFSYAFVATLRTARRALPPPVCRLFHLPNTLNSRALPPPVCRLFHLSYTLKLSQLPRDASSMSSILRDTTAPVLI